MNEQEKDGFLILLNSLDRAELVDVLRFAIVLKASRMAGGRKITAAEWSRLSEWQKRVISWQVRIMAGGAKAARFIRSLTGKAG